MTYSEVMKIVSNITYKPGYCLDFNLGAYSGTLDFCMSASVPSINDPTTFISIISKASILISGDINEYILYSWIYDSIVKFEVHEIKEWPRINGKNYKDPHPKLEV